MRSSRSASTTKMPLVELVEPERERAESLGVLAEGVDRGVAVARPEHGDHSHELDGVNAVITCVACVDARRFAQ